MRERLLIESHPDEEYFEGSFIGCSKNEETLPRFSTIRQVSAQDARQSPMKWSALLSKSNILSKGHNVLKL